MNPTMHDLAGKVGGNPGRSVCLSDAGCIGLAVGETYGRAEHYKLESMQLRKHCISKAKRHRARRSEFFGFVWFENIVFGRFAKCTCQPPRGFA